MNLELYCPNKLVQKLLDQYFQGINWIEDESCTLKIIEEEINFVLYIEDKIFTFYKPLQLKDLIETIEFNIKDNLKIIYLTPSIKFYPENRYCFKENKKIILTEKESIILSFLIKENKAISKSTLLKEIWGYSDEILTTTLETHIYNLRQKLSDKLIISVPNGYKISIS